MAFSSRTITSRSLEASFRHWNTRCATARDRRSWRLKSAICQNWSSRSITAAEAILLDNMSAEDVRLAVDRTTHHGKKIPLEVSGGVNLETVRAYAETGVDFISVGALTHSPQAVDMNLRIQPA